jgi:hypothetical protein
MAGFSGFGKLAALKGHGFSRAANASKQHWALAPELCRASTNQELGLFPQPV